MAFAVSYVVFFSMGGVWQVFDLMDLIASDYSPVSYMWLRSPDNVSMQSSVMVPLPSFMRLALSSAKSASSADGLIDSSCAIRYLVDVIDTYLG